MSLNGFGRISCSRNDSFPYFNGQKISRNYGGQNLASWDRSLIDHFKIFFPPPPPHTYNDAGRRRQKCVHMCYASAVMMKIIIPVIFCIDHTIKLNYHDHLSPLIHSDSVGHDASSIIKFLWFSRKYFEVGRWLEINGIASIKKYGVLRAINFEAIHPLFRSAPFPP